MITLGACAFGGAGCARAMAPPGGEPDQTPPSVVEVRPEPMSTIQPTDEPVVIVFDERISERNVQDAVYVSPATGAVDLSKGRQDLEVRIAGGWQPGRVYRVVVRPVIQDLFNNPITRPLEFAFSTGAPFSEAAVAGVAYERVTGSPVADVRVEARPIEGGAYHLALTDTGGIFRMPLVPPGSYLLRGYADQNRDRRRDSFEPADSMTIELGQADTLLRPLALMRPDSTAANLTRVVVVDSVTLGLELDDYMEVSEPQQLATVRVRTLPDSGAVELAGIYYPHVLEAERARQDSIARDNAAAAAAADTTGGAAIDAAKAIGERPAPRDTVRPAQTPRAAAPPDTLPPDPLVVRVREAGLRPAPGTPLPARELRVVLARPLVPEVEYVVEVSGILNLAGIPGGGGRATFRAPAPPPPPEEAEPQPEEVDEPPAEDVDMPSPDDVETPPPEELDAPPSDDVDAPRREKPDMLPSDAP
ncbi:MAG TPA: Ig-like domain-containing protein [Longimicrobiales bacterium]|nr:Ig-like domain-containing protein [Longimicrobiales bacterium]